MFCNFYTVFNTYCLTGVFISYMILPVQCKWLQIISYFCISVMWKELCFCESYDITITNVAIKLDINAVFSKRPYI